MDDLLRTKMEQWEQRARAAQGLAAQAYSRLVEIAQKNRSGQAKSVAVFLATTLDSEAYPFDLRSLRGLDVEISDDILLCIDALRWGRTELHRLHPEGEDCIAAIVALWGFEPSAK